MVLSRESAVGPPDQEEPSEGERVCSDDPLPLAVGEVQSLLRRGQRDVHDRRVEHDHQLGSRNDREDPPAPCVLAIAPGGRCNGVYGRCNGVYRAHETSLVESRDVFRVVKALDERCMSTTRATSEATGEGRPRFRPRTRPACGSRRASRRCRDRARCCAAYRETASGGIRRHPGPRSSIRDNRPPGAIAGTHGAGGSSRSSRLPS